MLDQGASQGGLTEYSSLMNLPNVALTYVPLNPDEPNQNPYVFGSVAGVMRDSKGDLNLAISIALNQWVASGTQQEELESMDSGRRNSTVGSHGHAVATASDPCCRLRSHNT